MARRYTDEELQIVINAFHGAGNNNDAAARALGIARTTFQHQLKIARERLLNPQPQNSLPAGHVLKGVSRYYNKEGALRGQWVKTTANEQAQKAALLATAAALMADIPKAEITAAPEMTLKDLLAWYVLSDAHIGQMSWKPETGGEWDIDLAEELIIKWFGAAIAAAPPAHTAVLAQLGDLMHTDGLLALTPASKNVLDASARYQKIVEVCVRVIRRIVQMLLNKHQNVHIIMADGNHDPAGSIWFRAMLTAFYEKEKRITVDNSHTPYYAFEWGQTSLFVHHGDKKRIEDVSEVFACMFREIFGRTKYSYGHMGHFHHTALKENALMIIEQHRTLAAKDAYSARSGYCSQRSAKVICYSKNFGKVSEIQISPEMVMNEKYL